MPGTTPKGFPYAEPIDPLVQWPATSKALAEKLEQNEAKRSQGGWMPGLQLIGATWEADPDMPAGFWRVVGDAAIPFVFPVKYGGIPAVRVWLLNYPAHVLVTDITAAGFKWRPRLVRRNLPAADVAAGFYVQWSADNPLTSA